MNPSALPLRDGSITIAELINLYMAHYEGRDTSRVHRLAWWEQHVGTLQLGQLTDDHLHVALEDLASRAPRTYVGKDDNGRPLYNFKRRPITGSTINRYAAAISGVLTWAIRRRIAPKGWDHPGRRIERRPENPAKTRFLSDDERARLLVAARACKWPRAYLLVLLALTTGARRGELLGLRWQDIDFAHAVAHVGRTKNGDAKALPLTGPVIEELHRLERNGTAALLFPSTRRPEQPYAVETLWPHLLRAARIRALRFHDLRHSCASFLAQSGATLLEIGDLLGHRQIAMTRRYSHLTAGHRSALVNRVLGDLR